MTEADLDHCYTELAEALGRVGKERSPLLLSTLCLALLARQADPTAALGLIEQAERLTGV